MFHERPLTGKEDFSPTIQKLLNDIANEQIISAYFVVVIPTKVIFQLIMV